jgi:hypothetical protein
MPKNEFHRGLIMETAGPRMGIPVYASIPTLAEWEGDIVRSMNRLRNSFKEFQQKLASSLPRGAAPIPQNSWSRVAGDVTNSTVVAAAIERYHAGVQHVGAPDNQLSQAIHGSLLVDIYTVTGQFMRSITRNENVRTDRDCALYPLYRSLHFAAADAFGRVFRIRGDEIDVYLRNQLIFMTEHGAKVDAYVATLMHKDRNGGETSQLTYLSDEAALALQLHVEDGLLKICDRRGQLEPFDCAGGAYMDITTDRRGDPTRAANPARDGTESNGGLGVAGFAMGLNRNIYARKHSLYSAPRGSFYHSSYLEGREVLCTGCITVVKGKLKYINNWSGHYQPKEQQLRLAVQALRALGVDITDVVVEARQPDRTQKVLRAPEFLDLARARFDATAGKVRAALVAYEERSNGWFSKPSEKSKTLLAQLKGIRSNENLVREVRFLLGGNLKNNLQLESPLKTPQDMRFSQGGKGELRDKLIEAMADFER